MRPVFLALGLCAFALGAPAASAEPSIADVYAKYPAPIGHRQPSVSAVDQARSARGTPAADLNEQARQLEGDLRAKLNICRGC